MKAVLRDMQGGRAGDPELVALGPWFHNLHLPDGRQTAPDHPLGDFPAVQWNALRPGVPEDLRGRTVLDVGCNAGFFAFECARRGASVHAIDVDERYLRQARWAAERFGLQDRITFEQRSVYRVHELQRRFDVVLFLGVLYHLRHPLLALDTLREVTGSLLLVQSLSLPEEAPGEAAVEPPEDLPIEDLAPLLQPGWPRLAFVERRVAADPTNWWIPNRAALVAMLRSSGFEPVQRLHESAWACRVAADREPDASLRRDELAAVRGTRRS